MQQLGGNVVSASTGNIPSLGVDEANTPSSSGLRSLRPSQSTDNIASVPGSRRRTRLQSEGISLYLSKFEIVFHLINLFSLFIHM